MTTSFKPLKIRQELLRHYKAVGRPAEFGPDGWQYLMRTDDGEWRSMFITCAAHEGVEWVHASLAASEHVPSYEEMCWMHKAIFGDGYAYQQFVPRTSHVNIHEFALHLWGRLDKSPAMPDFGAEYQSI